MRAGQVEVEVGLSRLIGNGLLQEGNGVLRLVLLRKDIGDLKNGVSVPGREFEHAPVLRKRLIVPLQGQQRGAQVMLDLDVFRQGGPGDLEGLHRLRVLFLLHVDEPHLYAGVVVPGVHGRQPLELLEGVIEGVLLDVDLGEALPGLGVVGLAATAFLYASMASSGLP